MKVIVFKKIDGTCGIVIPTGDVNDAKKDVPEGLDYRIIGADKIPEDRTFRDAWTDDNDTETIDVDMGKAKIIHMDKIRRARDEKLKVLDIETMKGLDVQSDKQVLRDLPENTDLNAVENPDDLKKIWPKELD